MPRLKHALLIVGLAALAALPIFAPALFGFRLFSGDVTFGHVYFFEVERELMALLGHVPNWLPQFYSGYPITLTLDGFMNPFFVIGLKLLPTLAAYHWITYAFFVANIVSAYALARKLGLSKTASIVAALTYAFSGIMMRWTEVIVFTVLYPVLPLSFLACLHIKEGHRGWWWALAGLLTYGWMGGFAELIVYDLVALGPFCLVLLFTDEGLSANGWKTNPFRTLRTLVVEGFVKYLLPVAISVLAAAPWLASVLVHISTSNRANGMPLVDDALPLTPSYLIHMIFPRLLVPYGGNIPFLKLADDIDLYIGMMPALLLLILPFVWRTAKQRYRMYFLGLLAFGLIMASNSPLYDALHALPVLKWFRWHFKWTFLSALAAGMLAGYAADLLPNFKNHRFARPVVIALWSIFGLGAAGVLAFTLFGTRIQLAIAAYGTAHYQAVAANANLLTRRAPDYYAWVMDIMSKGFVNSFSLRDPWTFAMLVFWGVALAALTAILFKPLFDERNKRLLLVAVTLLGSVGAWTGFLTARPLDFLMKKPATVEFLHATNAYRGVPLQTSHAESHIPYRTFAYIPDGIYAELQDRYRVSLTGSDVGRILNHDLLEDNINIWFDVDGAINHEPIASQRIITLQNAITGRLAATGTPLVADLVARFSTDERARLLGAMNVKYVLTMTELGAPWKLVFAGKTDPGGIPEYIYENPHFLPRWRFAERVRMTDPDTGVRAPKDVLAITTASPATTAIERRDPADGLIETNASSTDTLSLVEYTAGRLVLTSNTAGPRWVVFSETSSPFWRASIDGVETPIRSADIAYQAVLVPPGMHDVIFTHAGFIEQTRMSLSRLIRPAIAR